MIKIHVTLIAEEENVSVSLEMHGCISYFPTRLPTSNELKSCHYIELSSEHDWDPYSERFSQQERAVTKQLSHRIVGGLLTQERRSDVDTASLSRRL